MKTIFCSIVIAFTFLLFPQSAKAQAWGRDSKVLSLGFGASRFIHIDDYYYYAPPDDYRRWYSPTTGQLNFQGEFGVHEYVGLGFTTGVGGRGAAVRKKGPHKGEYYYVYTGEFNVPVGLITNFHFYQLIADNSSRDIHADKLDIYAGVNIGSGVAITHYENARRVVPMAFGGFQTGIRYFFTDKVGVNGEFGWGKSLVNIGFSFKL